MMNNREDSNTGKQLDHSGLGGNLVMFEYIDQLLKIETKDIDSETPFQSTQEKIKNEKKDCVDKHSVLKSNVKSKFNAQCIENEDTSTLFKTEKYKPTSYQYNESYSHSLLISSLKNIELDLTSKVVTPEVRIQNKNYHSNSAINIHVKTLEKVIPKTNAKFDATNEEFSIHEESNLNHEESKDKSLIQEDLKKLNTFDCVLIKIGTLLVALPMVALGTINQIIEAPTQLPGKPKWFLGVQHIDEKRRYNLIDTQDLLFSEQQKEKLHLINHQPKFSINVYGTKWALTCDQIVGSINVKNENIQWRQHSNEQLIAGTIKEKMCMLVNVTNLLKKIS
ncbi:chemotaxis protein CheW [Marinicellulosiphila megalodicopiae]|uniref:chemotaxis protein CheW n=1 Tax=Marinicellulosiphila megalodicopiae TaxID=2724896 RepID=UPI003BB07745